MCIRDRYVTDSNFKFWDMNEIQSDNYELIRSIDNELSATPAPTQKPTDYKFIFPNALEQKLTRDEILAVPQGKLLKARYEILARCGYAVSYTHLDVYKRQR